MTKAGRKIIEVTGIDCPHCGSTDVRVKGKYKEKRKYACVQCHRYFVIPSSSRLSEKPGKEITTRLAEEDYRKLYKAAKQQGKTVYTLIREIILEKIS